MARTTMVGDSERQGSPLPWTTDPYLHLPLCDHSFDPPIQLMRPENADFLAYFENTPSGPYHTSPGQHAWTDGSMVTCDE
eukprot:2340834-Rhodomonas_salina.1